MGGLEQFSVSPRPHGFGFGTEGFGAKGLGPGLDNKVIVLRHLLNMWGHEVDNFKFKGLIFLGLCVLIGNYFVSFKKSLSLTKCRIFDTVLKFIVLVH